jgi:hypothetical protein
MLCRNHNQEGVATLISNKADFIWKLVRKDKEYNLHNDKRNNPTRRCNNSKCICTEHQCHQVHKIILLSLKAQIRYNTRYNTSGRSEHPTLLNRTSRQKN